MFSNLKVRILGNYVKIMSINLKTSSGLVARLNKNVNDNKLENNVIRAKNKINDLALANNFEYFFTLTFSPVFDRYDLKQLHLLFKTYLRKMRSDKGVELSYLIVPEQHKDGAWHFHGFFNGSLDAFISYNHYGYMTIDYLNQLGYVNVQVIKDKVRVSSYVTKYVSKNLANGLQKYKHSYFCSTGLSSGVEDMNKIYDNEYFNNKFFDFKNDYCRLKTITLEEYKALKPIIEKM